MKLVVLSALSLLALAGCNTGQPRIYRVAIDTTPIRTIATPVCFKGSQLPTGRGNVTEQFYRTEEEWVIWAGVDQTEYLDLGTTTYNLGDSPTIRINELIEGTDKSFSALRNEQKPIGNQFTEARQTQILLKFNDYSFAPTGTINLKSQFACIAGQSQCPMDPAQTPADAASCESTINFVARRIEAQQITAYNNNPN